ncbi:MAG: hypothetical protein CVU64_23355 [Deltaproteobacteria bacterium HGW-Deltaproteobacteria-21]|nr:MAG: hypothetical protein CVU64_23355 [Deltaproteobacteria bacterium HGW-Deltaproteobacteria-21]
MCLILFSYRTHPSFRFILAANRDEYHARASAPPAFWSEAPHLLAGKDLVAGGTWLGITKTGRLAAVTNYRDPSSVMKNTPSRGRLVRDYLMGEQPPLEYLLQVRNQAEKYNGFNLLIGDREGLFWYSNRSGSPLRFSPGIFGISNRLLDTDWPKVSRGKEMLTTIVSEKNPSPDELFRMLRDERTAADGMLPSTGVTLEMERMLSPIFIRSPVYGTRSSTLIFIGNDDRVVFLDRTFKPDQDSMEERRFEFSIEKQKPAESVSHREHRGN